MALPSDIIRIINDIKRRVTNLETTPQPPNITLSNTASVTFNLSANAYTSFTATITDNQARRLLTQPNFSLYRNTDADNDGWYPTGSDWSTSEVAGLQMRWWIDWHTTNSNNVKVVVLFVNNSATNFTGLHWRINFRVLTKGVS